MIKFLHFPRRQRNACVQNCLNGPHLIQFHGSKGEKKELIWHPVTWRAWATGVEDELNVSVDWLNDTSHEEIETHMTYLNSSDSSLLLGSWHSRVSGDYIKELRVTYELHNSWNKSHFLMFPYYILPSRLKGIPLPITKNCWGYHDMMHCWVYIMRCSGGIYAWVVFVYPVHVQ